MKSSSSLLHFAAIISFVSSRINAFTSPSSLKVGTHTTTTTRRWQKSNTRTVLQMSSSDYEDVNVMVNGMPGPMATAAAEACLRKGLKLSPVAMTGPDIEACTIDVYDSVSDKHSAVRLIPSTNTEELESAIEGLKTAIGNDNLLAIDYTHPSAVNNNALFYVKNKVPFVMGTTGGDRDKLMSDVKDGNLFAVIAPNMGKQIVAMQKALEDLSSSFPSAFAGYKLSVVESHQKTKADTSGTAKACIDSIKVLNGESTFEYDDIEMIRDDQKAVEFGVPEDALKGHAFHTYTLTSPDGSVEFKLSHNVSGRTIYAEGTADAIKFLVKKMKTENPTVYSMINVLEEGALE